MSSFLLFFIAFFYDPHTQLYMPFLMVTIVLVGNPSIIQLGKGFLYRILITTVILPFILERLNYMHLIDSFNDSLHFGEPCIMWSHEIIVFSTFTPSFLRGQEGTCVICTFILIMFFYWKFLNFIFYLGFFTLPCCLTSSSSPPWYVMVFSY